MFTSRENLSLMKKRLSQEQKRDCGQKNTYLGIIDSRGVNSENILSFGFCRPTKKEHILFFNGFLGHVKNEHSLTKKKKYNSPKNSMNLDA